MHCKILAPRDGKLIHAALLEEGGVVPPYQLLFRIVPGAHAKTGAPNEPECPACSHSCRSDVTGSTRAARRAG